jgi:cytochrome P450
MVDPFVKDFQDVADFCLDRCIETGEIDFVEDYAILQLTLSTCILMGLPTEGKVAWANTIKQQPQMKPEDPDYDRIVVKGWQNIHDELTSVSRERRKNPTGDVISKVVNAFEPDREYEVVSILKTIFAGGVETTAAVLSNALVYLDKNHAARKSLTENPELMMRAREEFLRHFTPVPGLARTATKDTVLSGQRICEGERLLMWFYGANHDPAKFANPDDVVLDRNPNAHVSFGLGPHRCIGSNVARKNFDVLLNTVLRRVPDYALIHDRVQRYRSTGQSNSYSRLPARFTPGRRIGPQFKL